MAWKKVRDQSDGLDADLKRQQAEYKKQVRCFANFVRSLQLKMP